MAQAGARRPILAKKIGQWTPVASTPDAPTAPACAKATWQRDPLRVVFTPAGAEPMNFNLVGLSAVLVEDGDSDEGGSSATGSGGNN